MSCIQDYGKDKFCTELVSVTSQILNKCHDGELYFLGRSLEHSYDYLMGAFKEIPTWHDRLHNVIISMKGILDGLNYLHSENIAGFERQMRFHKLMPDDIIRRKRKTVIIDVIFGGGTLECFVECLEHLAVRNKLSVKDMKSKLVFVAIQKQSHFEKSRTEQVMWDLDFINECGLGRNSFHLLPVGDDFWVFCGNESNKKADTYPSDMWADD